MIAWSPFRLPTADRLCGRNENLRPARQHRARLHRAVQHCERQRSVNQHLPTGRRETGRHDRRARDCYRSCPRQSTRCVRAMNSVPLTHCARAMNSDRAMRSEHRTSPVQPRWHLGRSAACHDPMPVRLRAGCDDPSWRHSSLDTGALTQIRQARAWRQRSRRSREPAAPSRHRPSCLEKPARPNSRRHRRLTRRAAGQHRSAQHRPGQQQRGQNRPGLNSSDLNSAAQLHFRQPGALRPSDRSPHLPRLISTNQAHTTSTIQSPAPTPRWRALCRPSPGMASPRILTRPDLVR